MHRCTKIHFLISLLYIFIYVGPAVSQSFRDKIYFLHDDAHDQWCGFSGQSERNAEASKISAKIIGTASYENSTVKKLTIAQGAEANDWLIFDQYIFDDYGFVKNIERLVDYFPAKTSERRLYEVIDNKVVLLSILSVDTDTQKVIPDIIPSHVPNVKLQVTIKQFPFFNVLTQMERDPALDHICMGENKQA